MYNTTFSNVSPVPISPPFLRSRDKAQLGQLRNTLFIVVCPLDCTPSLTEMNRTIEACEGFSLVLECSTEEAASTVFRGNLLNCSNSDDAVTLLHSRFDTPNGTIGTCNNGKVRAHSLPVDNSSNCYTSLLCVMVSLDMVGNTIRCVHDNGTTEENIGNYTISQNTTVTTINPFTGNL